MVKIVLIGNKGVGKTTFVKRLMTGVMLHHHVDTLGNKVTAFKDIPSLQRVGSGSIWDTGTGKYAGLCEGYLVGANAVIVITDAKTTFADIKGHITTIRKTCVNNVPILILGNRRHKGQVKYDGHNIDHIDLDISANIEDFDATLAWIKLVKSEATNRLVNV